MHDAYVMVYIVVVSDMFLEIRADVCCTFGMLKQIHMVEPKQ